MIKITNPNTSLKELLVDRLTHTNPKFHDAQKMGYSTRGIDEFIRFFRFDGAGNMLVPRGIRSELIRLINQLNLTSDFKDARNYKPFKEYVDGSAINFRPYQSPAINQLLSTGPEGVLVSPAGSGKTVMGLSLIPITQQSTIWLTHTDRLFKQCHERCQEFLPSIKPENIGLIGGGNWSVGNILTIAMIPTLVQNIDKVIEMQNEFGLLILDECHHCPATTFTKIITNLNTYFMYGLTATPFRRDKLESLMFQCIGPVGATVNKKDVALHKGMVPPTIVYCGLNFGPRVEIANVSTIFEEFIVDNDKRNARIKNDVVNEAKKGNFCIVASGRKKHCEILHKMISAEWPRTGIATGKYSKKHVDEQVAAFDNKEITVLVTTPELLGEGFDVDFLNRLFVTTSFRTEARAEQLIGRIQRFHPDKKDSLVYEYIDENIGVLKNQYFSRNGACRYNVYRRLGLHTIDYNDLPK